MLSTFDVKKLRVQPNSIWLILLSFIGMSNQENTGSTWPGLDTSDLTSSYPKNGEPAQIFHLYCLVKDNDPDGDYRYIEDFVGLPTSQQVEKYVLFERPDCSCT